MPTVWIPSLLRDLTGGQETLRVPGKSVREVLDNLDAAYPGFKDRLCDADGLRSGVAVAVDNQLVRLGLAQPVSEASEIHFIPAIGGGACASRLTPGLRLSYAGP